MAPAGLAVRVRRASRQDVPAFLRLVTELARFEKLDPPTPAARRRLVRDGFGARSRFDVYMVETSGGGPPIGYAIALETYSSFLAKPTFYLEDIYIQPAQRRAGVGGAVMRHLATQARRRGCGRLEGVVLDWNQAARTFYQRLGARELEDWVVFRFDEAAIAGLAAGTGRPSGRARRTPRARGAKARA